MPARRPPLAGLPDEPVRDQLHPPRPHGVQVHVQRQADGLVRHRPAFEEQIEDLLPLRQLLVGGLRRSRGELHDETIVVRRNEYIGLLAAAADRWRKADDQEDRDGAREALLFRCRQLLEAEGLVSG